jgi:hypothetical protein
MAITKECYGYPSLKWIPKGFLPHVVRSTAPINGHCVVLKSKMSLACLAGPVVFCYVPCHSCGVYRTVIYIFFT